MLNGGRAKRNGEIWPCSLCGQCWTLQMEFPFRIVRVAQYGVLKQLMLLWKVMRPSWQEQMFWNMPEKVVKLPEAVFGKEYDSQVTLCLHMCQNITERDIALVIASCRMKCFYLKLKYRKMSFCWREIK